ncbi:hypothetical protein [Parasphingopyxis marina]|uniref:Uncharacterized protein n=1 Tax=Parasphingopyxis marina TaxID=2761622 RepID=A0A842HWL1_9SPHN|nr:hypothetical protein [Parasphingopyxis marina]MBC2776741.1 hypothetical protein [Parasphingopyxis marina]
MKTLARSCLAAALCATPGALSAQTRDLTPCEGQWYASIENIWVTDDGGGIRTFYNGAVRVLRIDSEEPAAASAGFVIMMPDGDGTDGPPGTICRVVWGLASADVDNIRSHYEAARGLILTVPTSLPDFDGDGQRPRDMRILINAQRGTMQLLD